MQTIVRILLHLLLAFTQRCLSQLAASNYITEVTPSCPGNFSTNGVANVTVITDLPETEPVAYCQDNRDFYFELDSTRGKWILPVYFTGDIEVVCVFKKKVGEDVYSIDVIVPLTSSLVTFDSPTHVVVCNYDDIGTQDTIESEYSEGLNPVQEIQQHLAEISQSDISICPATVLGDCITGTIEMGRTIMLKAQLLGDYPNEVSFQALSCTAVGKSSEYAILRGGCGDGVVIPREKGFVTSGKTATSPFFKSFRLAGSTTVSFECIFVVCAEPCDGSSCAEAQTRRRRDVKGGEVVISTVVRNGKD